MTIIKIKTDIYSQILLCVFRVLRRGDYLLESNVYTWLLLDLNIHLIEGFSSYIYSFFFFLFFSFLSFFFFFFYFRAAPAAYGGLQARGPIRAIDAGLHHSHSNSGSELHL